MPFAKKFRAMMDFPFAGDQLDAFTVESVGVCDQQTGSEGYIYDVDIVLEGPGGQRGVRQALKALFSKHLTTFSAYGNAYQLWFRKPSLDIESLGGKRYAVRVKGAGERIALRPELDRFLEYLETEEMLSPSTQVDREKLVAEYLEHYQMEIRRKVGRYDYKLRKTQRASR
jgi:hypothetical protein